MKRWGAKFADMAFTTLGYVVMQAQQRVGQPCWRYWFDYVAEAEHQTYPHGAWHGNEVAYVFDNLDLAEPVRNYANDRDRDFAARVADYWANFARFAGNDCHELSGPVRWPASVRGRDRLLRIGLHKRAGFKVENRFMRASGAVSAGHEASCDAGLTLFTKSPLAGWRSANGTMRPTFGG